MCAVPPFLSVELYARGGPVTDGVNVSNQEQDSGFPAVGLLISASAGAQCQKEILID